MELIILGAGIAGLSAAYHSNTQNLLIERNDKVGGLARSIENGGFLFDFAGHIIFTKDSYVDSLIKKLLADNIHYQDREAWIYSKNRYTRYPFQVNTYGLPSNVAIDCIMGLINTEKQKKQSKSPNNFKEWIEHTFGKGIAEHFMIPYNEKVWATPLKEMSFEWIEDRVMTPNVKEVLRGALESNRADFGPNSSFGYPVRGGSQSFVDSFLPYLDKTELKLNSEVTEVDIRNRTVKINGKEQVEFEKMISTLPLPELIKICKDVPEDVKKSADELVYTSVFCLNIGFNKPKITEKHWIYYPEEDITFQRLFVQSNASPYVAPAGMSSVTAEISHSSHKQLDPENLREKVVDDLLKVGFITSRNDIVLTDLINLKYGYIIFEKNRMKKVSTIREFLKKSGIVTAGRFGEWEYYNMDHAILSGKRALSNL